jgi:hypothetical protein
MAAKDSLKKGQHVEFSPSHNKALKLTGEIVKIHAGADDCVDIECDVDGKNVEVEGHVETAHAGDVTLLEESPKGKSAKEKKSKDED